MAKEPPWQTFIWLAHGREEKVEPELLKEHDLK